MAIDLARPPLASADLDRRLATPSPGAVAVVAQLADPVIVLGAGGKMGQHLCLMLQDAARMARRNLRVIAVSRFQTLRDRASFTDHGIETLAVDLSVPAEVATLPDAPTVFFLAGVKFGTTASPSLLETMNVVVPRLVAHRYRTARVVVFSTGCVYPFLPVTSRGATEATPPAPVGAYAASCLRREEAFASVAREAGTQVTLVRLNYSVEYRYGVLADIGASVLGGNPVPVVTGFVNLIWQTDALSQIIQTIAVAGSPAVPINITGAQVHRVRDLAARFGQLFDRTPTFLGEEAPTAWLSDASWSHQLFGPPAREIDAMVRSVASWLIIGGDNWGKPTGFERRDGKF